MAMPDAHALLGPSSAPMWMACTPSARLTEGMADTGSEDTRQGTLAHRLGELLLRERWEGQDITEELASVQADPLYTATMGELIDGYVAFIEERMAEAKARCPDPRIFIEQKVDLREYIPESFGTTDVTILADGLLDVVDLKYGVLPVDAESNAQLRIYALGSYLAWSLAYQIDTIRMTIYQPRLDRISTATMALKDLLTWAEDELKPKAALAWAGDGDFNPGLIQCRWCKVAATCRARADYQLEIAAQDFAPPATLSPEEIAGILARLPDLRSWVQQVETYALDAAVNGGQTFPGFKVVAGRSTRKYGDEEAIAKALRKAGFKVAEIYKPKELLGITAMEKLVGKKRFAELAGAFIVKPDGAPTLVPESDKRPALNTAAQAAEDFKEE